jgi:hypothetical protein
MIDGLPISAQYLVLIPMSECLPIRLRDTNISIELWRGGTHD